MAQRPPLEEFDGVVESFQRIAELNDFILNYPYPSNAEFERTQLKRDIADIAVGRRASFARLPDADPEAIERFFLRNPMQLPVLISDRKRSSMRQHDASSGTFSPEDFWTRFPDKINGVVVAVDAPRRSLVLRDTGMRAVLRDSIWTQVVDADGEQQVESLER